MSTVRQDVRRGGLAVGLALALLASGAGCGLDEVDVPDLVGPSEMSLSLRVTASPDILVANGFSNSVVQAEVRNESGQPVGGMEVVFTINDASEMPADIGTFISPVSFRDVGTAITVRTGSDGVARAVYESPMRTDFTAHSNVVIKARPVGTDFAAALWREVKIELRSAEPKLFPANPDNSAPACNFATQAPDGFRAGAVILFQSTASDEDGFIVRYEWFMTDGFMDDAPDIAHAFRSPGTYSVTHVVTDNNGAQSACAATLTVY